MHITTELVDLNWWPFALSVLQPIITVITCLLSLFVVLGNLLVVIAIWHENQLHSVTNYLIASLAAADCLVGAVVMPFCIISELIVGSWTFGETWCDLWHSFDVLASTASIMNLCAISLDRYLAITDPFSYSARMTPKRVALIIVFLWTCSILISFPAILWWKAVGQSIQKFTPQPPSTTISPLRVPPESLPKPLNRSEPEEPLYKCIFTEDTYYLLSSSFISFYGPLCVMLYAYYRIYIAATQQTKFLKHGSKQVMIGRSKKLKRIKHASEHSVHSSNDKAGMTGTSCDGISAMESYDRQHLVLRAHRGGGGGGCGASAGGVGGGNSSSVMSKVSNGEMSGKPNSTDKTRRKDLNHESFVSKNSFDVEQETKKGNSQLIQRTGDREQAILSNDKSHVPRVPFKGLSRKDRIALQSSKRDKLRVDSQRFDSKQKVEQEQENAQEQPEERMCNRSDLLASVSSDCKSELTTDSEVDEVLMDERSTTTDMNETSKGPMCNHVRRYDQVSACKPLVASMSNRSTSVDTTIINIVRPSDNQADKTFSLSPAAASSGDPFDGQQKDSSFIDGPSHKGAGEKKNWYSMEDDENSDDLIECDSDDSSSGSHGTGSIVSVMVRPQETQKNSDEKYKDDDNCDIGGAGAGAGASVGSGGGGGHSGGNDGGDPKLRRALSFGEARYKELAPVLRVNETTTGRTSDGRPFARPKHRASCGDPSFKTSDLVGFRTGKALNIKSLVKLAKPRPRKSSLTQQGSSAKQVKPPPSLMPLMMMNSDTSTDSSTVIGAIKRLDEKLEESDTATNEGTTYKLESVNIHDSKRNNEPSLEKSALKRQLEKSSLDEPNQMDRNLSFKEDLEKGETRGKGQVLYYDSDKLIQSIVDLTAIHYIDCSDQSNAKSTGKAADCVKTSTKETEKMNSEQSDLVQLTDNDANNAPRQHKKVGRRISRLAKERKAAKTLGIVVGVFILCWLPFFVVNIVVALCGRICVYNFEIVGSLVTWLGYLNSAMNPVIYARWSRELRRAFLGVLCKCYSWFLVRSRCLTGGGGGGGG